MIRRQKFNKSAFLEYNSNPIHNKERSLPPKRLKRSAFYKSVPHIIQENLTGKVKHIFLEIFKEEKFLLKEQLMMLENFRNHPEMKFELRRLEERLEILNQLEIKVKFDLFSPGTFKRLKNREARITSELDKKDNHRSVSREKKERLRQIVVKRSKTSAKKTRDKLGFYFRKYLTNRTKN